MGVWIEALTEKVRSGERISRSDAERLWTEASEAELKQIAGIVRLRYHQPLSATYLVMAIINYTNICVAKCDYCAFYRLPHQSGTYLLTLEQIREKIKALISFGGTMVGFNGGFHPKLKIDDYAKLFFSIREEFGGAIEFYGMTVAEFMFASKLSKLSYEKAAALMRDHGSRWITGGGAEVLDNAFRKRHSPGKFSVEDYFSAQRAILQSGMGSTATMVIGFDESIEERFNHLEALRNFQDESDEQRLASFLCWSYKPYHTELGGTEIPTAEYLRWIAICRVFLDNFVHIRTSVLTKNDDALEALAFGADDFDLPTEDEVTQKAGATISTDFEAILSRARQLGFEPRLRPPLQIRPIQL